MTDQEKLDVILQRIRARQRKIMEVVISHGALGINSYGYLIAPTKKCADNQCPCHKQVEG